MAPLILILLIWTFVLYASHKDAKRQLEHCVKIQRHAVAVDMLVARAIPIVAVKDPALADELRRYALLRK